MQVLSKYILVLEDKANIKAKESISGLIVPNDVISNMQYQEGTIFKVGTDVVETIKESDVVVFDRARGHNIIIGGVTYRVIREQDVAVVL